jgi:streptogramin lyase
VAPRTTALAAIALLALVPGTVALGAPSITEYSSGLPSSAQSVSITAGSDGALWFGEIGSGKRIWRVSTKGAITEAAVASGPAPLGITTGPDGNLWFTEIGGAARIGTLNPLDDSLSEDTLPGGSDPFGITSGPESDVWFTESGGHARIGRINPTTHELHEYELPLAGSQPYGITTGQEGDLWFTENANPGAIGRFDPHTHAFSEYSVGLTKNSSPTGIATGPEGDIWFTEAVNPGRIGRLDPSDGAITEFSSGLTAGTPEDIATSSDGNLYFTEAGGNGALGKITPAGTITQYTEGLTPKSSPWGITAGPDGNIWFTEAGSTARIGRLTLPPGAGATSASSEGQQTLLTAEVDPHAQATSYYFEYGASASYGSRTASANAGEGTSPAAVSATLTGLAQASAYHVRVVTTNSAGTTYGPDSTFTTAPAPAPPSAPTPTPTPLAAPLAAPLSTPVVQPPSLPVIDAPALTPVMGRSAGAIPVSGVVTVQSPSGAFVALGGAQTIPVGSVIDTSHGVLRLLTALAGGRSQGVTVWGGTFQVAQSSSGGGLTSLLMRGAPLACHAHSRSRAAAARAGAKRHSLWSQDEHGRYSTHGANSVATVMGTRWETVESCAGTLTLVQRGRVRVHDLHRGVTVVVSAGHSYLARP